MKKPPLYAYVDETGDRGVSSKSSRFFAMAAVVVPSESEGGLRTAIAALRSKFGIPLGKALHWIDHVKTYSRRRLVAEQLAAVADVCVNYVIFEKAAIPASSKLQQDQVVFYNYAAGLIMERILLTAANWPDGPRAVSVRFGHVRGFNHEETLNYFDLKRTNAPSWMPWHLLEGEVHFSSTGQYDGLQAADMYAGMLKVAICPDQYGGYEQHHFLQIKHQIRRYKGKAWGAGFKVMALPGSLESLPWWPSAGL